MRFQKVAVSLRAVVLAVCAAPLLPCGAEAQQIGGGVKAGFALGDTRNIDDLVNYQGIDTSSRKGFAGGGFLAVRFANGFSIQPEVLYTQKGVSVVYGPLPVSGINWQQEFKLDFIDVPVLARYTFGRGVRDYVFAGPSFDFKASATVKVRMLNVRSDPPFEMDIGEDFKSFEFAVVFGGGVELGRLLLEARWSEGLTNISKGAHGEAHVDVKTRTYLFLGGLRF